MPKEANARILINELLQRSGWRFFDDEHGPANVTLETNVKLKKKTLDELGDDFEKTANGYVDYLLLDSRGFPMAVLEAKAALLLAAIEFARRRIKPEGVKIDTPADVLPLIRHYADRKQEHFLCATLNGAHEVIAVRVISIGLADRSPAHPREVFADAVADRASAIIVAHNHPAGSLEPSAADTEVTRQLKAAGDCLGIRLLDHVIFNRGGYFSFLESGRL